MTSKLVQGFFPETSFLLRKYLPEIWEAVLPRETAERCPTPHAVYKLPWGGQASLRWPALFFTGCVPGILLGTWLGLRLLLSALSNRKSSRGLFCWAHVLLWYAVMNIGGLVFHCLEPSPAFAALDILGTSASSVSIILAALTHLGHVSDQRQLSRAAIWALYLGLGVLLYYGPPLLDEQMYLVPVLLAGVAVLYLLADTYRQSPVVYAPAHATEARRWLSLTALSGAGGFGTVLLDPFLCRHLGSHFLVVVWVFVGCNLAMTFLYMFASSVDSPATLDKGTKGS